MNLEYLKFKPIKQTKETKGLIGFCDFKYDDKFSFNEIAVHKIKLPANPKRKVRLRYPDNVFPYNIETQTEIDEEVSAYISAEYGGALK